MTTILESIKPVIDDSHFVSIDESKLDDFISSINETEIDNLEFYKCPNIPNSTEEKYIAYAIIYNSQSFCYWGDPKWAIEIEGKKYDGAFAFGKALTEALWGGYDLLNSKYLADLSEKDFDKILKGNVKIPFFEERLRMWKKIGETVEQKFEGSWRRIIEKSNFDAIQLTKTLVENFPESFKDESIYNGSVIKFYKKAQLTAEYINNALSDKGAVSFKLTGTDKLTAFADYKVPQCLRKMGILVYKEDLASKVDNLIEIPHDSTEEIEIRANTIEAIERITQKAKGRFPNITASQIDGIAWSRGQVKSEDDKPYHRSPNVWY